MKELLKSIAEAKKEFGKISKDSKNPFFKSKYFDINQLLDSVESVLQKNGLMCLQPIKDNKVYSIIYHVESGDSIESSIDLPDLTDPQKLGSAITYYRRYTLQSLLSLQAEDDDGNKASNNKPKAEPKKQLQKVGFANVATLAEWCVTNSKTTDDLRKHYEFTEDIEKLINNEIQKSM